jgi:chromate reductase, NAD(P)H dehydrogenase (quinone)
MTAQKKTVLAISGSTRRQSSNHLLLRAISAMMKNQLDIVLFDGIAGLPHFDPDIAEEQIPVPVRAFKQQLRDAAGIIICTPEYAHGVPGALKNAIDWTVSSGEFGGKPTVLITASTDGRYGHGALLETLRVIEAMDVDRLQLLIPFIRTKVSEAGITDEKTLAEVQGVMEAFCRSIFQNYI